MSEEIENTTEGVSRRNMLKKSALVGGTMVWAAPVVQSFTAPAFGDSHGTPDIDGQDISYIALLLNCGGTNYRVKFEESEGSFILECGVNFETGNCPEDLPGSTESGCPTGLTADDATLNGDGSVTIDVGTCTITDFVVKCGQSCLGPAEGGQPNSGGSGEVTFFPCPKPE